MAESNEVVNPIVFFDISLGGTRLGCKSVSSTSSFVLVKHPDLRPLHNKFFFVYSFPCLDLLPRANRQ